MPANCIAQELDYEKVIRGPKAYAVHFRWVRCKSDNQSPQYCMHTFTLAATKLSSRIERTTLWLSPSTNCASSCQPKCGGNDIVGERTAKEAALKVQSSMCVCPPKKVQRTGTETPPQKLSLPRMARCERTLLNSINVQCSRILVAQVAL